MCTEYLSSKYKAKAVIKRKNGAGTMTQCLRAFGALVKALIVIPSTKLGGSQLRVTPPPGSHCEHLYSCAHIHIVTQTHAHN